MVEALKKQVQYLKENGFTEDHLATKKDLELLKKDLTIRLGSIMVGGIVVLSVFTQLLNQ